MLRSQDVNPGELYGVLSVGFVCAHKMSYLCVINYMGNVIWDMHCFMNQPHRIQLIVGAHMVLGRVLTGAVARDGGRSCRRRAYIVCPGNDAYGRDRCP